MCIFITATMPQGTNLGALAAVGRMYGPRFAPVTNAVVQPQLPPGSLYLVKQCAQCDCGTVLGSVRAREERGDSIEHEVEKRKRAGWSARKLERWLAEKRTTEARNARVAEDHAAARQPEAESWLAYLRAAVGVVRPHVFGLLLHFYRTGPATERLTLAQTVRVPLPTATPETLLRLEEDVLHLFVP
ncbi:MAG: hypothetical protein HY906_09680 [Deltaproteobacteria bacterium]|nr:hypothetical protein [Deltaproteobacteria bacterium]